MDLNASVHVEAVAAPTRILAGNGRELESPGPTKMTGVGFDTALLQPHRNYSE